MDWSGIEDTFLSMQLFQSRLMKKPSGLISDSLMRDSLLRDKVETTLTLLARQDFINETIEAEVLWLHNTNNKDGLIRPKISYEWQDDVNVWLGLDLFYGDEQGLFGQFDQKDRLIMGVEWGF